MNYEQPAIKRTLLLAALLFLVSAPEPDASTLAEMSGDFLVPVHVSNLLANETEQPVDHEESVDHEVKS
jgi:hypothetical protein